MRRERRRLGLSQPELAVRLAGLGWFGDRTPYHQIVGKLERGERPVSVGEWLMLAVALEVAPVVLLMQDRPVEVPGVGTVNPWELVAWVAGHQPLADNLPANPGPLPAYEDLRERFVQLSGALATLRTLEHVVAEVGSVASLEEQVQTRRREVELLTESTVGYLEVACPALGIDVTDLIPRDLEEHVEGWRRERDTRRRKVDQLRRFNGWTMDRAASAEEGPQ